MSVVNEKAGCNARCLVALYLAEHRFGNGESEKSKDGPVVLDVELMYAALVIVLTGVERSVVTFLLHRAEDVTARWVISHNDVHDAVLVCAQAM